MTADTYTIPAASLKCRPEYGTLVLPLPQGLNIGSIEAIEADVRGYLTEGAPLRFWPSDTPGAIEVFLQPPNGGTDFEATLTVIRKPSAWQRMARLFTNRSDRP